MMTDTSLVDALQTRLYKQVQAAKAAESDVFFCIVTLRLNVKFWIHKFSRASQSQWRSTGQEALPVDDSEEEVSDSDEGDDVTAATLQREGEGDEDEDENQKGEVRMRRQNVMIVKMEVL